VNGRLRDVDNPGRTEFVGEREQILLGCQHALNVGVGSRRIKSECNRS
jgi:hypothetical protein